MSEIKVFRQIMGRNNAAAEENKKVIGRALAVNIMSSPGSGKTALLEKTLRKISGKYKTAVIEGDVATSNDAKRIKKHLPAGSVYQIKTVNFGGGCHLSASMIRQGLDRIKAGKKKFDVIIIENVGNLICPADFYLGEDKKIVLLSVTEGDDKPLKYPGMFESADLVLITKTDLLSHVDFSLKAAIRNIRKINMRCAIMNISSKSGQGLEKWIQLISRWITEKSKSR